MDLPQNFMCSVMFGVGFGWRNEKTKRDETGVESSWYVSVQGCEDKAVDSKQPSGQTWYWNLMVIYPQPVLVSHCSQLRLIT